MHKAVCHSIDLGAVEDICVFRAFIMFSGMIVRFGFYYLSTPE